MTSNAQKLIDYFRSLDNEADREAFVADFRAELDAVNPRRDIILRPSVLKPASDKPRFVAPLEALHIPK